MKIKDCLYSSKPTNQMNCVVCELYLNETVILEKNKTYQAPLTIPSPYLKLNWALCTLLSLVHEVQDNQPCLAPAKHGPGLGVGTDLLLLLWSFWLADSWLCMSSLS